MPCRLLSSPSPVWDRHEPEIALFVKEHGKSLELSKFPCTPEQAEWEDIANSVRKKTNNE